MVERQELFLLNANAQTPPDSEHPPPQTALASEEQREPLKNTAQIDRPCSVLLTVRPETDVERRFRECEERRKECKERRQALGA